MGYERFVALGDSCTEGLDDPHPADGRYRGWADLVAARLAMDAPGFRYANLGVRGRRLDQITAEQVPALSTLEPDLVALFGGANDVLAGSGPAELSQRVDTAVRQVTGLAPKVVVFTLSDISHRMPFGKRLRPRIEALNEAIREAATRYGAELVDLWPDHAADDLRYFGRDRLHLSDLGHRRLAAHLLTALAVPVEPSWLADLPGAPTRPDARAHAEWLWHVVRPVALTRLRNRLIGRSPGDGFLPKRPELLPVSTEEIRAWISAPLPGNA
ncbi:SGNH/GDSL hydrolase family protein [Amycolatopsis sp. YIM 10]|uniref:SGNH/GDSL hydrolase family protein n=1 Tax=Amycolatopsis sp. YIM 10 TaxID=2653857 RepID=UPI001290061B|nr:SGNH/GDSL hydrolase family protein [Amycolatopsis sp. YIM 10]QFU86130.1 GDSL-like Lipase/Acylhydrolase [Amycolatopsis sp. YIM 10]